MNWKKGMKEMYSNGKIFSTKEAQGWFIHLPVKLSNMVRDSAIVI